METQMFTGFIQERDLRRQGLRGTEPGLVVVALLAVVCTHWVRNVFILSGLFEVRAQEYLDSLPGSEQRGVNKFLKGLGEGSCSTSSLVNQSVSVNHLISLCLNLLLLFSGNKMKFLSKK